MLIVNADDFGLSDKVNEAILYCFNEKIISDASIMANMEKFEDAVDIVHKNELYGKVGVHFNITSGKPLTEDIKKYSKFCDENGVFSFKKKRNLFYTNKERIALRTELRAQIQKIQNSGIVVDHFDSHHHVHEEIMLYLCIASELKKNGIISIRNIRTIGKHGILRKIYKKVFNYIIRKNFITTEYFGNLKEYKIIREMENTDLNRFNMEIMLHPIVDSNNEVIDLTNKVKIPNEIDYNKSMMISFHNIG